MAYKIFFAYQSDTDDRYNKGFIHQASLNAIDKLKTENYDIEFDFGFKKTPGSPILISEMLKKNDDADMVLVDLTFTSSKNGFDAKKISKWGKTIAYYKDTPDKLSPNPNVLLETGYAWSKKGQYRTLIVMNKAFGHPDNLPVDFKGFRWGITYSLDSKNYEQRKPERKKLTEDLYDAFKNAINEETSYQIEKWRPFRINQELSKLYTLDYHLTPELKNYIVLLRNLIKKSNKTIRICGVKGSGKSRLTYEFLRGNDDLERSNLENRILYYDLLEVGLSSIDSKLIDLISCNQPKIIILDNCAEAVHIKIQKQILYTPIKLISIASEECDIKNIKPDVHITTDVREKFFKEVAGKELSYVNTGFLLHNLQGNLNTLNTIIYSRLKPDAINQSVIAILKEILDSFEKKEEALKLIQAISIFHKIPINGDKKYQSEFIREKFINSTEAVYVRIIEELKARKLIVEKGHYILLNGFSEEIFEDWIKLKIPNLNEFLMGVFNNNLNHQFSTTFSKIITREENVSQLENEGGLLSHKDFLNSEPGSQFLNAFAEYHPKLALAAIKFQLNEYI